MTPIQRGGEAPLAIVYSMQNGVNRASAGPVVLYDQQPLDFVDASAYLEALGPAGSASNDLSWTDDSNATVLSKQQPFIISAPGGSPVPTAAPNAIYVQIGKTYGPSTVTVSSRSLASSVSLKVLHFPALSLGCTFRSTPAYNFDADRAGLLKDQANWTTSDLYETMPRSQVHPLDPCYGTVLETADSSPIWHAPYGATLVATPSFRAFGEITADQWRNAGTEFSPATGETLIFKTAEGTVVKALLPIGPYEAAAGNSFPF